MTIHYISTVWLAQLVEHWTTELEVADSSPDQAGDWYDHAGCVEHLVSAQMIASLGGDVEPLA